MLGLSPITLLSAPVLTTILYVIYQFYFHPLSKFPGPILGILTPFWRFYHELRGDLPTTIDYYHQRYGAFIRVSPSEIDIDSPEVVDVVYKKGGSNYVKSNFYGGFTAIKPNIFGTRDEEEHRLRRRQMAHAFSQASLLKMEYIFDRHTTELLDRFDQRAEAGKSFQLGLILRYYSHDINGDLSLGLQFGTLDADDRHRLPPLNDHIALAKLTGYVPTLKPWFDRYGTYLPWPYLKRLLSSRGEIKTQAGQVTALGFKRAGRDNFDESGEPALLEDEEPDHINLFTSLVRARDPETGALLDKEAVASNAMAFLAAGSHSTAASLDIWFWYLLHHREVYEQVREEIRHSFPSPADNATILEYAGLEAALPYTSAVFKEVFRLSPTFQHPAPRMTPANPSPGYPTIIADTTIPPGFAVSASIFSLHRNRSVWGDEAGKFKPDRWLNDSRAKENERLLMHFGAGHRACIGRNQALIVLWKCIVETLRRFEFSLADMSSVGQENPALRVTGFAELAKPLFVKVKRRKE